VSDDNLLFGKKALVTGGAKRLGRDTALSLARAGVHLAIHFNQSRTPAEELSRELEKLGVRALPIGANLIDPDSVEPLFHRAWEELGGIDFLVNNASVFPAGRLDDMELPELHRNLRLNAWAPFLLIRAFWRQIRGTDLSGSVVNLLDTRLVGGDLAHAPYHLSKAMLRELTTLTALEFAPELRVNGVAPGAVLPPEGLDEEYLNGLTHDLPLKRRGYPKDIADAVGYLLSAQFVTGQIIFVDGGRHIRMGGST
jgi:pteridine reductase